MAHLESIEASSASFFVRAIDAAGDRSPKKRDDAARMQGVRLLFYRGSRCVFLPDTGRSLRHRAGC